MLSDADAKALADPETGWPVCKILLDSGEVQATAWMNKPLCSAEVNFAAEKLCILAHSNGQSIMGDEDLRNLASTVALGLHEMAKKRMVINVGRQGPVFTLDSQNRSDLDHLETWFLQLSRMLQSKGLIGYK